ncbi:MetQ/NlpA family ABC transporter substrate-binding protein [Ornithinibacillus massiliensis]|uniref:Lipoprotein n=1 Tax=Ornithinibacillus massiliensis TaxID=1944633 RepID=A0ABS5MJ46_9BACI|nr:MetQ/NlpA family ABC transporter substrate-binding protein [Ornithinibacillus massiliensis]MBS3682132.1 MetQ/NlpA family ABC transporter substrate-binding protein [Ornithinibacillus massiliensis]
MKKLLVLLSILLISLLAACGSDDHVIKIGATSTPHAEVLEKAKPILEEEGITIEIEEYSDYNLLNLDLDEGTIDANYFQHIPFFEKDINDPKKGYDLVNLGGVHIEPMGVYSKNITSVDNIPEGTEVIISRNDPDHYRILQLFEAQGLIKIADDADTAYPSQEDIVENPLNLQFLFGEVNAEFLIEAYNNEADALVAINTNYAIEAELSPLEDALFIEGEESDYVNIIAARAEDKDNEDLKKVVEVLQSEEIQNFIIDNYNGAVVPVGGNN